MKYYVSPNLRRHGDSQELVQWMFFAMAFCFWAATWFDVGPVMREEVYGVWVVGWPTRFWAGSLMLASGVYLLGIIINGRWRWSPLFRMLGALWHSVTLTVFAVGASTAAYGENLMISSAISACVHLWFAYLNFTDLRGAYVGH